MEERELFDWIADTDFETIEKYAKKMIPYFNNHLSAQIATDEDGNEIVLSANGGKT
jgi:hypothetical protein